MKVRHLFKRNFTQSIYHVRTTNDKGQLLKPGSMLVTEKIAVACLSTVTSSFPGDGIKEMVILNFSNLGHGSVIGYFLDPLI